MTTPTRAAANPLPRIIDTPHAVSDLAPALAGAGVETVIRYYNHRNSTALPSKRLNRTEANRLAAAGLSLGVVFQQRGGAKGNLGDLDAAHGARDGSRAASLAREIGQPEGSAVYFAVDHDYWREGEISVIAQYFEAARRALGPHWRLGVYGSGRVGGEMKARGLADLIWLAGAKGWSGTGDMLERGGWALFQNALGRRGLGGALSYDGNLTPSSELDFGQFVPEGVSVSGSGAPAAKVEALQVVAPSGLRLRRGPGTDWPVQASLSHGTRLAGLARQGAWVDVDLNGDGQSDGFMHGAWLAATTETGASAQPAAPSAADAR